MLFIETVYMPAFMLSWQSWVAVPNRWPPKPEVVTPWFFTEKIFADLWSVNFKTFFLCICVNVCVCVLNNVVILCACNLSFLWNILFSSNFCWIFIYSIELKSENHYFSFYVLYKLNRCYLETMIILLTVWLRIDSNVYWSEGLFFSPQ